MARKNYSEDIVSQKKEEILHAAMTLLETNGTIEAITFRKIAALINCSYSAPYRYFSSKEELLIALRTRAFRWMEDALTSSIDNTESALKNFESLTRAYVEAGISRPDLYQLMFFEIKNEHQIESTLELDVAKRECLDVCTQVMIKAQKSGEVLSSVDPLTASHVFWVSAHGLVSLQIANQLVMGRSLQDITQTVVNTVLLGLNSTEPQVISISPKAKAQSNKLM